MSHVISSACDAIELVIEMRSGIPIKNPTLTSLQLRCPPTRPSSGMHLPKSVSPSLISHTFSRSLSGKKLTAWSAQIVKLNDVMAHAYFYYNWSDSRVSIISASDNGSVTFAYTNQMRASGKFFVVSIFPLSSPLTHVQYNVLSELDEAGEYYISPQGLLFFMATGGQEILLSITSDLVSLRNVNNLMWSNVQIGVTQGSAVSGAGNNITLSRLLAGNSRSTAVYVNGYNNTVDSCEVTGSGAAGIYISGGSVYNLTNANSRVTNCKVHDNNRWTFTYQPAINTAGCGIQVDHNLLYNGPHNGLLFSGNNHLWEGNVIRNFTYDSDDSGVMYCGRSWASRGNVIRNNFFGPSQQMESMVEAIYLDDKFSSVTIEGNIITGNIKGDSSESVLLMSLTRGRYTLGRR